MPSIQPFRALRYNPKRVGSLARVVTPPYDVISPEGQKSFYKAHPFNFIRIVYGKKQPSDAIGRNSYTRARAALEDWTQKGVLQRDLEPGVYPYEQEYRLAGKKHRRLGLIGLVRLDAKIYPHEQIFGGPKLDRLELMKTVDASLDPIFGLVPDEAGRYRGLLQQVCASRKPLFSFEFQGVRHRLWRITDPAWIKKLQTALRSKDLVIADGHHRFEAAKTYREERRKEPGYDPKAPYNFVMFYLSAAGGEDPGLLPTHRLVNLKASAKLKESLEQAKRLGVAEALKSKQALVAKLGQLRERRRLGIGLYTGNGAGYLLQPRGGSAYDLDVEWLHEEVLPNWLDAAQLSYTQDLDGAYRRVRKGNAQAVFVMQTPRLKDVLARARAARRMPRKTTYFYPKLVSGLVGFPFGD